MKLNAVGVTSKDMRKTTEFYRILGFVFPDVNENEAHVESIVVDNSVKFMIDNVNLIKSITGEEPKPGNHSGFALSYDSPTDVDETVRKISAAGFTVIKQPWDAPWHQRYAIVQDPDGYRCDLYSPLVTG